MNNLKLCNLDFTIENEPSGDHTLTFSLPYHLQICLVHVSVFAEGDPLSIETCRI